MLVPGVREYLSEADVAALRVGDQCDVDSRMGGSFVVEFIGHQRDQFVFAIRHPDFHHWGPLHFTFDEVRENVFQIAPQNPYFRSLMKE